MRLLRNFIDWLLEPSTKRAERADREEDLYETGNSTGPHIRYVHHSQYSDND